MATMTLYLSPLSLRLWRELRSEVNGNLVTSILREGEFIKVEDDLFFQLRERRPDGTLRGIFLSDSREDEETVDYIAERGAVLDSPLGIFLVLSDGTIQTRKEEDSSCPSSSSRPMPLISRRSPARQGASLYAERAADWVPAQPDPDDRYYQRHSGKFTSELHTRFTTPINAFLFAVISLVVPLPGRDGTPETVGDDRDCGDLGLLALAGLEFVLGIAARDQVLTPLAMYVVPIAAVVICAMLILLGIQPKAPDFLIVSARSLPTASGASSAGRPAAVASGSG